VILRLILEQLASDLEFQTLLLIFNYSLAVERFALKKVVNEFLKLSFHNLSDSIALISIMSLDFDRVGDLNHNLINDLESLFE
jgi:hypothetical protein